VNQTISTLPTLDGLRGLATLMVVLCHAMFSGWLYLPYSENIGTISVMIFFALSGFLMSHHYLPGNLSLRYWLIFLIRRTFRIYPNFMFVLCMLWAIRNFTNTTIVDFSVLDWNLLKRHLLLQEEHSVFWTIPVEIEFYALLPFISALMLMGRFGHKTMLYIWIELWLLEILVVSMGMLTNTPMFVVWHHLPIFTGGVIMGYSHKYFLTNTRPKRLMWSALAAACICTIYLLCFKFHYFVTDNMPSKGYTAMWFWAPLTAFTVLAVSKSSGIVGWLFSNPISRFLGKISYSTYLIHVFILWNIHPYWDQYLPHSFLLILLFIFTMAWILYVCIEKPFIHLGKCICKKLKRQPLSA